MHELIYKLKVIKCFINHALVMFEAIILITISYELHGQTAPDKYRILLSDKNNSPFNTANPQAFLSNRAIQRRLNQNIPIKQNDIPVNQSYVSAVKNTGATILTKSKWFNCLTVYADSSALSEISALPFVTGYNKVIARNIAPKQPFENESEEPALFKDYSNSTNLFNYGYADNQIQMLNGIALHNQGYQGQGIVIAVLDAGFYNVDDLPAFDSLWENKQILGTRDFVDNDTMVYDAHTHGMQVLSIIGGNMPGELVGTAPKAKFWLIRTEDTGSEFIIEEDNWVAGAEFADSAGADIITTSLGYNTFNDPVQNHTYADMDGNTARATIGADIAASKGMLVVVSAGNDGNSSWYYIGSPADADSVIAVGAVDSAGYYVFFSSHGPTYDGRVKPNVTAKGYLTAIQSSSGSVTLGNGTSFSCPLISGLAACLWQANPGFTNMELLHAIEMSADHYQNPDNNTGYGIPNFAQANLILNKYDDFTENNYICVFPNPFSNYLNIEFYTVDSQSVNIEISDIVGRIIYSGKKPTFSNSFNFININDLTCLSRGIYIIKLTSDSISFQTKIIKN